MSVDDRVPAEAIPLLSKGFGPAVVASELDLDYRKLVRLMAAMPADHEYKRAARERIALLTIGGANVGQIVTCTGWSKSFVTHACRGMRRKRSDAGKPKKRVVLLTAEPEDTPMNHCLRMAWR